MMVISRGGLYYTLLYMYLLDCVFCVVREVSIHGEATIILYQTAPHTTFSWSHYNKTVVSGNASYHWSCNSTKYVTKLVQNQCCDLTIMNVQTPDLGNYILHVVFSDGKTSDETVVVFKASN
nr:glycoprotein vIgFam2.3 [Elephant endotheliotropic herpesvirus 1A]